MPEPATLALFPWRPPASWAPAPQDAASAGEGAEDDEADDEEAPAPGGFMAPGSTTCIEVSGTVTAGLQRDWYKAGARTNAAGLKPVAATSFPLCASFRIESGQTLENDVEVVTAFEFQTSTASDAYVSRYVLTLPRIGLQPGSIKLDRLAAELVGRWRRLNSLAGKLQSRLLSSGPSDTATFM